MLTKIEDQAKLAWLAKDVNQLDPKNPTTDYESIYDDLHNLTDQVASVSELWDHEEQHALERLLLHTLTRTFLRFLTTAEFNDADEYDQAFQTALATRKHILDAWEPYTTGWDVNDWIHNVTA